jgi:hypothetical protein
MIGKLDDREAQFEAEMERYVSGLNRAVRDLGMALGQASLMKDETEALRSKKAAKAAWTKTEEQIKAEFRQSDERLSNGRAAAGQTIRGLRLPLVVSG